MPKIVSLANYITVFLIMKGICAFSNAEQFSITFQCSVFSREKYLSNKIGNH